MKDHVLKYTYYPERKRKALTNDVTVHTIFVVHMVHRRKRIIAMDYSVIVDVDMLRLYLSV